VSEIVIAQLQIARSSVRTTALLHARNAANMMEAMHAFRQRVHQQPQMETYYKTAGNLAEVEMEEEGHKFFSQWMQLTKLDLELKKIRGHRA